MLMLIKLKLTLADAMGTQNQGYIVNVGFAKTRSYLKFHVTNSK